ncbi:MAG: hypothetical protein OXB88_11365 [Bacteriovoracales bacterium]|nr:hypothetical protein [Bacteriovoracales bacterium]
MTSFRLLTILLSSTAWAFGPPLGLEDFTGRYRLINPETQESQTLEIKSDGRAVLHNDGSDISCNALITSTKTSGLKLELSCRVYPDSNHVKLKLDFELEKITKEMMDSKSFTTPVTVTLSYKGESEQGSGVLEWRILL